jgi:hypothetical protein
VRGWRPPPTQQAPPWAAARDHIAAQAGIASERFMWVGYAQLRPNMPLSQQQQQQQQHGPQSRLQRKTSALQECMEQLMTCKCECG